MFVLFRVISFHRSFVLLLLLLQSSSNPPLLSPQPYHGRDPLPAPALVARVRGADRGEAVVAVRMAAGERGEGRAGRRGTAGAASNRGVLFSSSFFCVRLCCFGSTSSSRSSSRSTSSSSSSNSRRRRRGKGTRRQRDDPRDRPPRPGQQPPVQQRQHCQDQLRELPPDQLPVEIVERERSRGRRVDGLEPGSQRGFEQRAGAGPLREEEDGVGEGGYGGGRLGVPEQPRRAAQSRALGRLGERCEEPRAGCTVPGVGQSDGGEAVGDPLAHGERRGVARRREGEGARVAIAAAAAAVAAAVSSSSIPPPPSRRKEPPQPPAGAPVVDEAQAKERQPRRRGPDRDRLEERQRPQGAGQLRVEPRGNPGAEDRGEGPAELLGEQARELRVEPGGVEGGGSRRWPACRRVPVAAFLFREERERERRGSRVSFFFFFSMPSKSERKRKRDIELKRCSPGQRPHLGLR